LSIAISMATYRRKDGKTPFYLKRAVDSVFAQEYNDFKLFLIGDCYDDDKEWASLVAPYEGFGFYCVNLDKAVERDKYKNHKNKMILWNCGGAAASNFGSALALEEGFDYVCHLDHDDYWRPSHLKVINKAIEETKADWFCTKSVYGPMIYPLYQPSEYLSFFLPLPYGLINSSTCFNHRTIPLRYRDTYEATGSTLPGDGDLWGRMAKYIMDHGLLSYLINEQTCFHEEEGYLLNEK